MKRLKAFDHQVLIHRKCEDGSQDILKILDFNNHIIDWLTERGIRPAFDFALGDVTDYNKRSGFASYLYTFRTADHALLFKLTWAGEC